MTNEQLRLAIRKLPMVRAREIDGEESDGTPVSWRDRPFVSLTQLERLLDASDLAAHEAVMHAGAMLSNCAFNLAQRAPGMMLTADDISALNASRIAWDNARAAAKEGSNG